MTESFIRFYDVQAARDYRHEFGTGGWIFVSDNESLIILFPPHISPSDIFHHQFTKGLSGNLIGSA